MAGAGEVVLAVGAVGPREGGRALNVVSTGISMEESLFFCFHGGT